MNVDLDEFRSAIERVRNGSMLERASDRLNVRELAAIVGLGALRKLGEIGGWPPNQIAVAWAQASGGRRNRLIEMTESLFEVPTSALIRHTNKILNTDGSVAPDLPEKVTLDPLSEMPSRSVSEPQPQYVIYRAGVRRRSVKIPLMSSRWHWNADAPYEALTQREFNPGNILNSQQGLECFFPVSGKARADAVADLSIDRPQCPFFKGTLGSGRCDVSSEECGGGGAKKKTIWPRAILTKDDDHDRWAVAPDGFVRMREHVRARSLGSLRNDLSIIAGVCKALRDGQTFADGSVVIDRGWFATQISDDAWEALSR